MQIANLVQRVGLLVQKNSPAILTGAAVAGTLAVAYLTGKAAYKAAQIIHDEEWNHDHHNTSCEYTPLDTKEKIDLTWKLFVAPVGLAALTVTAIIFARHIDQRRAAVVAAMYALSERTLGEYREKVVETIGERKANTLQTSLGQDRYDRNPDAGSNVFVTSKGNTLAYEAFTARPFTSNFETLRAAQNEINERILERGWQSLNDLYDILGLEHTSISGDLGWSTNNLLKMHIDTILSKDKDPCIYFEYMNLPEPRSFRD